MVKGRAHGHVKRLPPPRQLWYGCGLRPGILMEVHGSYAANCSARAHARDDVSAITYASGVADSLLCSLRDHLLDEAEPLAGLLRKCLMLGAATGSQALRQWAQSELTGYDSGLEVPSYRKVGPAILADKVSGNAWVTGIVVERFELPEECWDHVPEEVSLRQPIDELAQLASTQTLMIVHPGLGLAKNVMNARTGPYEGIVNMKFALPGSIIVGVLGQVRTRLVEIVADLTADVPLTELPRKETVDAAVNAHIHGAREIYNTTINQPAGPVAVGAGARAITKGLSASDVVALLDGVQAAAAEVEASQRAELLSIVGELRDALKQPSYDVGAVVKNAGRLRRLGGFLAAATASAAIESAVDGVITFVMAGVG